MLCYVRWISIIFGLWWSCKHVYAPNPAFLIRDGLKLNTIFIGLPSPIRIIFVPSSPKVVVANKNGRVFVFPSLTARSTEYTELLDLREEVHDRNDHGLLEAVLHPDFDKGKPFLYLHYIAEPPVSLQDSCNAFPGPFYLPTCALYSRLTRYKVSVDMSWAGERVALMDRQFCVTADSHGVGQLRFDGVGNMYAAFGDGAQYDAVDYGIPQDGCRVSSGGVAQGQYLAQDDNSLRGKLIRINAEAVLRNTPLVRGSDYRILAKGLRNPVRMAFDPFKGGIAISNVGWDSRDEVEYLSLEDMQRGIVVNFGWPCYEGTMANEKNLAWLRENGAFASVCDIVLTQRGASAGTVRFPAFQLFRGTSPAPDDAPDKCNGYTSAPVGLNWYTGVRGEYKLRQYADHLFFNDYARGCGFAFPLGADRGVNWAAPRLVYSCASVTGVCGIVDQVMGPDGYMYLVDLQGQSVLRLAESEDESSFDNGNLYAVSSLPDAQFQLNLDQPDRTWSCCSEAGFELEVRSKNDKMVGAPVFSISVSHCLYNPCTGQNDCHQHTVSNFLYGEDLDTGYWGGWWRQQPHAMDSQVSVAALTNWGGQYVKTVSTTHARTHSVTLSIRPLGLRLRAVLEDTSCWNPPCKVEKMSGTTVAAVALPISTATGEELVEFVDWSVYDGATGQLVGKGSEGAYSEQVTRDVELVALYRPLEVKMDDNMPPCTGVGAVSDFGFVGVTWDRSPYPNSGMHTVVRAWSDNGVVSRGVAVLAESGAVSVPVSTSPQRVHVEVYLYNPTTKTRSRPTFVDTVNTLTAGTSTSSGSCAWSLSVPLEAQVVWEQAAASQPLPAPFAGAMAMQSMGLPDENSTSSTTTANRPKAKSLYPGFLPPYRFHGDTVARPDRDARSHDFESHFARVQDGTSAAVM